MCCLTQKIRRKAMEYIKKKIGNKLIGIETLTGILTDENIISHDVTPDQVDDMYQHARDDMGLNPWN